MGCEVKESSLLDPAMWLYHFHFLYVYRDREEWSRIRKALAPKMLRPKDVRENLDNFSEVTRDAIEHMVSVRGTDDVIPNLEEELAKWATECK